MPMSIRGITTIRKVSIAQFTKCDFAINFGTNFLSLFVPISQDLLRFLFSLVFSSVWVSTDDLEIYNEARISGANVYARSEENASDTASSLDAVSEFYLYFQSIEIVSFSCE